MSIALLALAGILIGGALSLRQQGAPKALFVVTLLLAALSAAGGLLWLYGRD